MNLPHLTRREFLRSATTAGMGLAFLPSHSPAAPAANGSFSFVLLGDLHYDRIEHHDMARVKQELPNILSSIPGFCQKTKEILPPLFTTVCERITELNRDPATRVAFVLQVGDVVQGACCTEE